MKNEPVVTTISISALVGAIIACAIAFGVELTQGQTAAIIGLTAVVAPLIAAVIARGKVTPVE